MAADHNDVQDALGKHVKSFVDASGFFSRATVEEGLKEIHSSHVAVTAEVIARFNGVHASGFFASSWRCPHAQTEGKNDYSRNLHLGTTRIWKADGSIDEARWAQFAAIAERQQPEDEPYFTLSAVKNYLAKCNQQDPQEHDTGRNTDSLFSSGTIQATAAIKAWEEVFNRLASRWVLDANGTDTEPCLHVSIVREFFENSEAAFSKAVSGELPIPKPEFVAPWAATL